MRSGLSGHLGKILDISNSEKVRLEYGVREDEISEENPTEADVTQSRGYDQNNLQVNSNVDTE